MLNPVFTCKTCLSARGEGRDLPAVYIWRHRGQIYHAGMLALFVRLAVVRPSPGYQSQQVYVKLTVSAFAKVVPDQTCKVLDCLKEAE